jgi:glycosyltransferase involved in cell wall biosynthesis
MQIFFIVATKDRPDDLRKMLRSLAGQSVRPDGVIIVDGSDEPVEAVVAEFAAVLPLNYIRHRPPSASAQRNAGIRALPPEADLAGFLDDDAALEPGALERMMAFWETAPADLGGAAFNMVNHPEQALSWIKRWPLVKALGIYSGEPGRVTASGWQTMIGEVNQTISVDWLPSTAVIWRAEILKTCHFDEFFTGYSYLEDLDFSFSIRRCWRLAVVADARYGHYPSPVRHVRQYGFGKTEVRNRLYFVTQHGLSYTKCWLGLVLRAGMTLCDGAVHFDRGALSRVFGNCTGMAAELKRLLTKGRIPPRSEAS